MLKFLLPILMSLVSVSADAAAQIPETAADDAKVFKTLSLDDLIDRMAHGLVSFAINLALALLVFYVGKFIINKLYRFVSGILTKRSVDRSITSFVLSMIRIVLYFILLVTVIGILGIETSSFIAIFASAGVAVGMALSGTLQNFAGGVLILLLKPYKVGDYIEAQGYAGTVREIQIFHTLISTADNKLIIIPNGGLSTGSVNNWSKAPYRRIDWTVSLSYGDDVELARTEILRMLNSRDDIVRDCSSEYTVCETEPTPSDEVPVPVNEPVRRRSLFSRMFHRRRNAREDAAEAARVASEKADTPVIPVGASVPDVVLKELGASSVDLRVTAWAKTSDYWKIYFEMNEMFYNELPKAGLSFPFPQMDVHLSGN